MTAIATSIKICTSCKGFGKITYYRYAGEGDMRCPLCDGSGVRRFPIRRNALRLLRPTWALPPILDMPRRVTPDGEGQVKGSELFCVA